MNNNKTNRKQKQQGDLLITRVTTIPDGDCKTISARRCVLAEGEATGHAHVVEDTDAELIQIWLSLVESAACGAVVPLASYWPVA